MTDAEADRFRANRVAKLVGLLPYIAESKDAERTALTHLATFVLANRGQSRFVFDHKPADDESVLARLRTIADFQEGDAALIARGMALLGLCLLSGYRRDSESDVLLGEYNPLASGAWTFDVQDRVLKQAIDARPSTEMDTILTADQASGSFWQV